MMIKHVVCIQFNEFEQAAIAKEKLMTLPALIPQIISMEVGVDVLRTERSYDLVLTVVVANLSDLDIYAKHPEHLKVLAYIGTVKKAVVAVDYEC